MITKCLHGNAILLFTVRYTYSKLFVIEYYRSSLKLVTVTGVFIMICTCVCGMCVYIIYIYMCTFSYVFLYLVLIETSVLELMCLVSKQLQLSEIRRYMAVIFL